ncbi:MAG: radical SAM protein [Prevotella sp.]|nr:radical SAM protein [Prevotella sp.]
MTVEQTYQSRIDNPLYNTSYPIRPSDWSKYRINCNLPFNDVRNLSFYIHIPFCQSLCSFCEYTKMRCPSVETQMHYVTAVESDVRNFVTTHPDLCLKGFDIGGGTPTALEESAFERLMKLYVWAVEHTRQSDDFEPSIEGAFETVTETKVAMIRAAGIRRMSLGVQSNNEYVLSENHRQNQHFNAISDTLAMLRRKGIEKVNLDFMYGLKGQSFESLAGDVEMIRQLAPEQVTLYELRTNMITERNHTTPQEKYDMYAYLFDSLCELGYCGIFGQNTFSRSLDDLGVSSYLRHRMRESLPYKGFGLSAQSLSANGISYNVGKLIPATSNIFTDNIKNDHRPLLGMDSFHEEYAYLLPNEELASKYVAIAAYSGAFSLSCYVSLLNLNHLSLHNSNSTDATSRHIHEIIDFCKNNDLLSTDGDLLRITRKGFLHYGAVFSLFYASH